MKFKCFKKGGEGDVVSERDSVMTGYEREYIYVDFLRYKAYKKHPYSVIKTLNIYYEP